MTPEQREQLLALAARHRVVQVRVFGSRARGDFRPDSDLDLLVQMESGANLFDLVGFQLDAEELLGQKVDVVEAEGLHRLIRDQVLRGAVGI